MVIGLIHYREVENLTRAFGEADVQKFCEIFDRLSNNGISDPAELYRKGVKEYLKPLLW